MTTSQLEEAVTDRHLPPAAPIFQTFFGYLATAALGTAVSLGVFDALAAGASDASAVSDAIGAEVRGTTILLNALVALGFVAADAEGYHLTQVAESFLVSARPTYLGSLGDIFYSDWQWHGFLHLADAVRAGGTSTEGQDLEVAQHPFWETYAKSWGAAGFPAAAALTDLVAPWAAQRRPFEVLDVACGDGLFSFVLADALGHARLTLLDQENVLASTGRKAGERGLGERVSFIAGDMFEVDLGGPYDLVIASNVFHLFGEDRCRQLLERIGRALKPGGRLAIHEFAPGSADTADSPVAALFSLVMLVRTHTGQTHTLADYRRLLGAAGFAAPEVHRLDGQPTSLLLSGSTSP